MTDATNKAAFERYGSNFGVFEARVAFAVFKIVSGGFCKRACQEKTHLPRKRSEDLADRIEEAERVRTGFTIPRTMKPKAAKIRGKKPNRCSATARTCAD